ncbi:MAG: flagellar motor protein MotD [Gammaproteobacteria bacterium]|nr:flagellar motor protein MotD [Gammaproteobacteria bacterium]
MRRKKHHEEPENHERWLVSYADFITLLFAFFVVMYSVSSVNVGKYRVVSDALKAEFGEREISEQDIIEMYEKQGSSTLDPFSSVKPLTSPDAFDVNNPAFGDILNDPDGGRASSFDKATVDALIKQQQEAPPTMDEIADTIEDEVATWIEDDSIAVRRSASWVEVELKSSALFSSGSSVLSPFSLSPLEKIIAIAAKLDNPIHVEGFTDDQPISTDKFPSNWELSAARAASVVRLFVEYGVEPSRMSAVGYGEFRPLSNEQTEEARNLNRRVSLVILAGPDARYLMDVGRNAEADSSTPLFDTGAGADNIL